MAGSSIATLAEGRLYALHNAYLLDGRVSSYPAEARGWAASNCYLLRQDDGALLLDTGFAAHEAAILGQLGTLIGRRLPLAIMPLRINEFMSVGNAMPIAGRFNVVECYSNVTDVELWLDFDSDTWDGQRRPAPFRTTLLSGHKRLPVGSGDARLVDVYLAPVRLIGTQWTYDASTRTLFTSDTFAWVWRDDPDGPWAVGDNDDATTPEAWRKVMTVEPVGYFNAVHAALPFLRSSRGSIVAVTSAATIRYAPRDILSAAPKASVDLLTRAVAREEGRNGIRTNVVAPGFISAGLGQRLLDNVLGERERDGILRNAALRRVGLADEVADVVVFLASARASFVTGQAVAVDGGYSI